MYITEHDATEILQGEGSILDWPDDVAVRAQLIERASRRVDQLAFTTEEEARVGGKSPRYTDSFVTGVDVDDRDDDNAIPQNLAVQVALLALWYAQNPNSFYNRSPAGEESLCKAMSDLPLSVQTGLWAYVSDEVKIDVDELPQTKQDRQAGGSMFREGVDEGVPAIDATARAAAAKADRDALEAQAAAQANAETIAAGDLTDDQEASDVPVDSSAFSGHLTQADDTVQKVADALDGLDIGDGLSWENLLADAQVMGENPLADRVLRRAITKITVPGVKANQLLSFFMTADYSISLKTNPNPNVLYYLYTFASLADGTEPYTNETDKAIFINNSNVFARLGDNDKPTVVSGEDSASFEIWTKEAGDLEFYIIRSLSNSRGNPGLNLTLDAINFSASSITNVAVYMQQSITAGDPTARSAADAAKRAAAANATRIQLNNEAIIGVSGKVDAIRQLPEFPDAGSRDNKVAKFDGDTLGWEADAEGTGGGGAQGGGPARATTTDVDAETDNAKYMTVLMTFRAIARRVKLATTRTAGIIQIASNTEAQAGTDETKAMTPGGTRGLVASILNAFKAGNTEIDGESDDTKFVTTAKVFRAIGRKVKTASSTVAGIVELANQTEADAGTDTTKAMTPALVKRVVDAGGGGGGLTSVGAGGKKLSAGDFYVSNAKASDFDGLGVVEVVSSSAAPVTFFDPTRLKDVTDIENFEGSGGIHYPGDFVMGKVSAAIASSQSDVSQADVGKLIINFHGISSVNAFKI